MIFKVGDVVTVRKDERHCWVKVLAHDTDTYTIKNITTPEFPCCVGHSQSLEMTDGTHASGAWFDSDLDGKPKKWCSGHGYRYEPYDDVYVRQM